MKIQDYLNKKLRKIILDSNSILEIEEKVRGLLFSIYKNVLECEIDEIKEPEPEPEQLTIAGLIKEAKEKGFKWVAQNDDKSIFYFKFKPIVGRDNFYYPICACVFDNIEHREKSYFKTNYKVKKWYEGDWINSLIEVK